MAFYLILAYVDKNSINYQLEFETLVVDWNDDIKSYYESEVFISDLNELKYYVLCREFEEMDLEFNDKHTIQKVFNENFNYGTHVLFC